ncbi:unnamed protein product, partial [Didymodactylos carnosus]
GSKNDTTRLLKRDYFDESSDQSDCPDSLQMQDQIEVKGPVSSQDVRFASFESCPKRYSNNDTTVGNQQHQQRSTNTPRSLIRAECQQEPQVSRYIPPYRRPTRDDITEPVHSLGRGQHRSFLNQKRFEHK